MREFEIVTEEEFNSLTSRKKYSWRQLAPDLRWMETCVDFIWGEREGRTVGYRRTLASGNPEYKILKEFLDY